MKDLLIQQGLHKVLDLTAVAAMKPETKEEPDENAGSAIMMHLSDDMVNNIIDEETALKIWTNLETLYMSNTMKNKLYLKKQLYALQMREAPKPEPPVENAPKKSAAKSTEKKGKEVIVDKEVPLDPLAEKLRQQRLVEEADYSSTAELFSKKGGDDKILDNFIPKSESDFLEYAELISHKLRPYEKSYHYIGLLKAVMRLSITGLKGQDAKDIATSVTAISNEKIKAEKEANASKKKSGAKKQQLIVDRADDEAVINAADDFDDYDFM